ncbi:ESX secretion-associated protein EspG [Actinokineospora sp.]|uniref:ESX secretion-associated protein EspG n=1 Tax=Actinokineospora sp. TaxID=1872133 RepID=UPI0040375F7F
MTPEFLSPLALDLLWESLDLGELPYPLEVRSHGETADERADLRDQVFSDLRAQGTADDPRWADWLSLLARADRSVDSVFLPRADGPAVRALAVGTDSAALLATQDESGLWLRPLPVGALVSAIVDLLPPAARGTETSLTTPVDPAAASSVRDRIDLDRRALVRLFDQPRLRVGQFAANTRDRLGGRRRSTAMSWFDTESGRYLTYAKGGWATIAPADTATLRHRLGELLASIT